MSDLNSPQTLAAVSNETMAGTIVSALSAQGIDASMVGELTAGFRAEAPGLVKVMVRLRDLPRAQAVLAELEADSDDIDWSQVDVGEPLD